MKRRALTVCAALVLLGALPSCEQPMTVDQQIIATILEMKATIEAGERRAFMDHVSEDFIGQNGVMTRDQLRGYVILQLNRYKRLKGRLFPIDGEWLLESANWEPVPFDEVL